MMRTAVAIAAGLLCALYGHRAADGLRQDARCLSRWAEVLTHLELLIAQAALPLPQVLMAAADTASLPDEILRSAADRIEAQPLLTIREAFDAACPACAGREILLRLADRLGRGDASQRSLACRQACDEISRLAESARQRAASDSRLRVTLGWTCGACLTLLLL